MQVEGWECRPRRQDGKSENIFSSNLEQETEMDDYEVLDKGDDEEINRELADKLEGVKNQT